MKKRLLSILLSLAMVLTMIPFATMTAFAREEVTSLPGSGSKLNPYLIGSLDELKFFSDQVNNGNSYENKHIRLTKDIEFDVENAVDPIGDNETPFSGNFNGEGHTVKLIINKSSDTYVGLFGCISGGRVTDVNTIGSVTGGTCVGGISGCIVGGGAIIDCNNYATINGSTQTGGICGSIAINFTIPLTGTITNCHNDGTVSVAGEYAGGICGALMGTIENSYNSAAITGSDRVGGICGGAILFMGKLVNCYNSASVTATFGNPGGLCGYDQSGTYTNCYYDVNLNTVGIVKTNGNPLTNPETVKGIKSDQMKASSKSRTAEAGKPLVDLLNNYIKDNKLSILGWRKWVNPNGDYPTLKTQDQVNKEIAIAAGVAVATVGTIHTVKAVKNYKAEEASKKAAEELAAAKALVEGTKLAQNKLVLTKKGSVKVSYEAPTLDGVLGYEIQRATDKDFTKHVRTYNNKKLVRNNSKNLKKGTKYYYRVRAKVQLADGSIAYTDWSNTRYIKATKTR